MMNPVNVSIKKALLALRDGQERLGSVPLEPFLEEEEVDELEARRKAIDQWYDAPLDDLTPDGKARILTPQSAREMLSEVIAAISVWETAVQRCPRIPEVEVTLTEFAEARKELERLIAELSR